MGGLAVAVTLSVVLRWRHCYCLHPGCCLRPCSSWQLPVADLPAIAGVPCVVCVSLLLSNMLLLGVLLSLAFLLLLTSLLLLYIHADPGVSIIPGVFTYWTVQWDILFFLDYRTTANSRNYRTVAYRIKASSIGYRTQKKLSVARFESLDKQATFYIVSTKTTRPAHLLYSLLL